ncbi:neuropeptide FF receptor 1 isoform X1 [Poecile atricapillus]|uniref:neuropeptide FF receptor 1 isoform X1 n=1 Tax=Poecile atricapillus TaxID=48891 RepID=UPI0027397055|nr:neuropeptide FF receptor 1 isoform X1 [Poecile atricapillus]
MQPPEPGRAGGGPSYGTWWPNSSASHLLRENYTFLAYYQHSSPVALMFILAYTFIFLMCVIGNVLVCFVVVKNRQMRTVTNMFLLNLAISDLLVGIFCMPTTLVDNLITGWPFDNTMCKMSGLVQGMSVSASVFTLVAIAVERYVSMGTWGRGDQAISSRSRCPVRLPLRENSWECQELVAALQEDHRAVHGVFQQGVLPLGLKTPTYPCHQKTRVKSNPPPPPFPPLGPGCPPSPVMSPPGVQSHHHLFSHRFRCIVHPFRQKLTLRKALLTIAIIWVLALLIMCPAAVTLTVTREEHHFMVDTYNNSYPLYSCWEAWPETEMRRIYTIVLFSHIYVAPLALIVIMYARIAFKLFKSVAPAHGGEEPEGRRISRRKAKVINMLIIVALFFTISWLPLWTLMLLTDYGRLSEGQLRLLAVYVYPFAHWLAFFNSSANPIIYGYFNENFRRGFQEVFRAPLCSLRCQRRPYAPRSHGRGTLFGTRNRIFTQARNSDSPAVSESGPLAPRRTGVPAWDS